MTEGDEIDKALCTVLAKVAEREKEKAIQVNDYGKAFIAAIFEGLFREVEHKLK